LYGAVGIARGDRQASAQQARRNFELFDAPHVAIITSAAELGVYGAVDCGVYLATFLYALDSLGLGAVPQAALANHSPFIREHFDIPEDQRVLCGVSFGYRDDSHPANQFRTQRAAIAETTRWVSE
jgi:nitroreductase